MKNKKLIAYAILAVCWEKLLEHALITSDTTGIWVDNKEHTIALIQNSPEYDEQPTYIVRDIILQWILDWLDESKMVILYTCPDNREIALHDPKDFTEALEILEDPNFPELTGILYMAHD